MRTAARLSKSLYFNSLQSGSCQPACQGRFEPKLAAQLSPQDADDGSSPRSEGPPYHPCGVPGPRAPGHRPTAHNRIHNPFRYILNSHISRYQSLPSIPASPAFGLPLRLPYRGIRELTMAQRPENSRQAHRPKRVRCARVQKSAQAASARHQRTTNSPLPPGRNESVVRGFRRSGESRCESGERTSTRPWTKSFPQWSPENRPKAIIAKPANGAIGRTSELTIIGHRSDHDCKNGKACVANEFTL